MKKKKNNGVSRKKNVNLAVFLSLPTTFLLCHSPLASAFANK